MAWTALSGFVVCRHRGLALRLRLLVVRSRVNACRHRGLAMLVLSLRVNQHFRKLLQKVTRSCCAVCDAREMCTRVCRERVARLSGIGRHALCFDSAAFDVASAPAVVSVTSAILASASAALAAAFLKTLAATAATATVTTAIASTTAAATAAVTTASASISTTFLSCRRRHLALLVLLVRLHTPLRVLALRLQRRRRQHRALGGHLWSWHHVTCAFEQRKQMCECMIQGL